MEIAIAIAIGLGILQPVEGNASQYDQGVMEQVVANRQAGLTEYNLPAELPKVSGYAAVLDCDEIGKTWLVKREGGEWELMLVVDCSGDEATSKWMKDNNIVIEVGYETAVRWGVVGEGVEVEVIS